MAVPPKPQNHKKALPFRDLVQYLLQPLQDYTRRPGTKGRPGTIAPAELKRAAVAKFVARWRTEVGDDLFPVFRLLMPDRDKDRSMYKIKEANMAKLFIKILGISPASEDAISLEKWKIPGSRGAAGDFPGRLYEVLRARAAISDWGDMSIDEVNEGLDQLSRCTKESQQRPIMTDYYNRMSAQELRWLCCIILRSMKIGATERTIFDIWHPDAYKLFNKSSSLSRVCWELYEPDYRLPDSEKDISVFSCFQPQLAAFKKNSLADVVKKMGGKLFYIEEKLDGERIQLHKKGDQFQYWSRKAKDYTYLYGTSYGDNSNQEGGGLTKYLQHAFNSKVKSIVLDGEMITWNDKFDAPVGFGSLKSAAKAEKNNTNTSFDGHPFYCVFDILYLNGKSLTHYSLRDRRKALKAVIRPVTRRIEIVPVQEATKEFEIEARLRECIATASEGLIVKDPDTAYRPNDRNESWIKVKPEYMEEFGENLDLLIIGGYWGEGRRGNRLSSFLCGVREDQGQDPEPCCKFKSFVRVGGGFNGPDYAQIDHMTAGHWHTFDRQDPPSQFYEYAVNRNGTLQEVPDMWIAPQDSVVIQLKAASATASDQYAANVTLRFPRFECIREDKDWRSATSLQDFVRIQASAVHEKKEKLMNAHVRRKKAVAVKKKELTIQGVDQHDLSSPTKGNLFKDMQFNIMTESKTLRKTKTELENLILSNGGQIVHHEGDTGSKHTLPSTRKRKRSQGLLSSADEDAEATTVSDSSVIIIAERKVVRVASLISRGKHDILRPSWILACLRANRIISSEPQYFYHMTAQTSASIRSLVDEYHDSYTNDVDVDSLGQILQDMAVPDANAMRELKDDIDTIREDIAETVDLPLWLFRRFHAYFDLPSLAKANHLAAKDTEIDPASTSDPETAKTRQEGVEFAQKTWINASGSISEDIHDQNITHIIVDRNDRSRLRPIRNIQSLRRRPARVVSTDWITQSWSAMAILSEEKFAI